jgi:hypothetical protein
MHLVNFIENKQLMTDYKKWINRDIATIVCGVLQETFCRPILPNQMQEKMNTSTSEFALGEISGAWKMLDALRSLESVKVKNEIVPETYGAEVAKEREHGTERE